MHLVNFPKTDLIPPPKKRKKKKEMIAQKLSFVKISILFDHHRLDLELSSRLAPEIIP